MSTSDVSPGGIYDDIPEVDDAEPLDAEIAHQRAEDNR